MQLRVIFQIGLYAILIRWQARTFDCYFPSSTFAVLFLGLLVPGISSEKIMGASVVSLKMPLYITADMLALIGIIFLFSGVFMPIVRRRKLKEMA